MIPPKNEDLLDQKNPIIKNSEEEADLEKKDAAEKSSNKEKEEAEKKEKSIIEKVIDGARAVLRMINAVIKAINQFMGFKPKNKLKSSNEELGDEESDLEQEIDKWTKFFDKLLGKAKKSEIEEQSSVQNEPAAQSPKDNSSSLRDSIFSLTSEAQNFMQETDEDKSADEGFKSAKDESKNNSNDEKDLKSTEDALRQMVESVALSADPNLIKKCETILEEARVQSPELESVTKNLSTTLVISTNKEVMGICNKLKSSDNINSNTGKDASAAKEIGDVSLDSGLSR